MGHEQFTVVLYSEYRTKPLICVRERDHESFIVCNCTLMFCVQAGRMNLCFFN